MTVALYINFRCKIRMCNHAFLYCKQKYLRYYGKNEKELVFGEVCLVVWVFSSRNIYYISAYLLLFFFGKKSLGLITFSDAN